jgi:hypothetical protein
MFLALRTPTNLSLQTKMATRSMSRSCSKLAHNTNFSSGARAFLQLAPRRYFQTTPPLDFLLPSIPSTAIQNGRLAKASLSKTQPSRAFTSSSIRRATHAVVNPKKDDDGNDMTVEITPRASNVRPSLMFMYRETLTMCFTAPKRNYVPRLEPEPRSTNPSRKRRVPRLPIPDVPDDAPSSSFLPFTSGRRNLQRDDW